MREEKPWAEQVTASVGATDWGTRDTRADKCLHTVCQMDTRLDECLFLDYSETAQWVNE